MNMWYRNIKRNPDNATASGSVTLAKNSCKPNASVKCHGNHAGQNVMGRHGSVVLINENDKELAGVVFTNITPSTRSLKG